MAKFKQFSAKEHEGKIVYEDGIVKNIVALSISELEYVYLSDSMAGSKRNSIKVTFDKDKMYVNVSVTVHFSQNISDIAFKIQEIVRHNVESMTEYHVAGVNVNVNGISFDEIQEIQSGSTSENNSENTENNDN